MAEPHLRVFGVPELRVAGQPVRFRTRKQFALFVYLVFEARERPVFRDFVIALLWPEVSPPDARHSLSQALTAIRNVLGKEAVSRGSERMHLDCGVTTDLDVLAAGRYPRRTALGQPLEDLETVAGTEFGHWVEGTRARCLRIARDRLLEQLEGARREGHVTKVHERAALLYGVDPLCDTAALALAERFLLAGDAVGATRVLRGHLEHTQQEIGCTPNRDIVRLLRRLESGAVHTTSAPAANALAAAAAAERDVFIGRTREIARLEATWTAARGGSLHTCLIVGPAGIGKSSLVRRFATTVASRGAPVFTVSCQEIGRGIPFATVSEFIYSLSRDPEIAAADPAWLAEASRVTPGLKAVYPGIPDPPTVPPEAVRLRVAEALLCLLNTVSDSGPALVVFDDVQHMDPASRDVLHVLLRRLEGTPTFVLGTQRVTDVHPFRAGSRPADAISWEQVVEMVPFEIDEALALVAARTRTGDALNAPVRMKIVELSQGNAYLLEMLLSDWERDPDGSLVAAEMAGHGTGSTWQPPEMMRDAFGRLYRGLSVMAKHVLELLSVAGKPIDGARLSERLGESRAQIDRATLELVERGMVRMESGQIGFKNEMHRAFVYYAMSEDSRKFYHLQLTADEELSVENFQATLERGHHLLRAGLEEQAVRVTTEGARNAIVRGGAPEAERCLREVVTLCNAATPPATHVVLASALVAQGSYAAALSTLTAIEGGHLDPSDAALEAIVRAESYHRSGLLDDPKNAELAKVALQKATSLEDRSCLLRALQVAAEVASETRDARQIREIQSMASSIAGTAGDVVVRARARITEGFCSLVRAEHEKALCAFREAAETFGNRSIELDLRHALAGMGICYTNIGDYENAEAVLLEAVEVARRIRNKAFEAVLWNNIAVIYDDLGLFERAVSAYREGCRLLADSSSRRSSRVWSNVASLALSLGSYHEATKLLDRAERSAQASGSLSVMVGVLLGRTDLWLALGEEDRAWETFGETLMLTNGQALLGEAVGQYERLRRQYVWATAGYDAFKRIGSFDNAEGLVKGLASQLEVGATEQWIDAQHDGIEGVHHDDIVERIVHRSLFGVLARLLAVGVHLDGLSYRKGESSAGLVQRLYPDRVPGPVPTRVLDD